MQANKTIAVILLCAAPTGLSSESPLKETTVSFIHPRRGVNGDSWGALCILGLLSGVTLSFQRDNPGVNKHGGIRDCRMLHCLGEVTYYGMDLV
ncbi:hypothetical protein XENTR_v10017325 [Xenopus tropicalis]|nr:hypothetical protein XENTR_v10017325 [Xenopus tropicalis]